MGIKLSSGNCGGREERSPNPKLKLSEVERKRERQQREEISQFEGRDPANAQVRAFIVPVPTGDGQSRLLGFGFRIFGLLGFIPFIMGPTFVGWALQINSPAQVFLFLFLFLFIINTYWFESIWNYFPELFFIYFLNDINLLIVILLIFF